MPVVSVDALGVVVPLVVVPVVAFVAVPVDVVPVVVAVMTPVP